jgi:hypothetical protein
MFYLHTYSITYVALVQCMLTLIEVKTINLEGQECIPPYASCPQTTTYANTSFNVELLTYMHTTIGF